MYCVRIIQPNDYPHWEVLSDLADGLTGALQELGVHDPAGRQIILGAHLLGDMSADAIVMNTEVVDSPWFTPKYLALLAHHEVLDYSAENVKALARHSIHAKHCPIGYHECLERIERTYYTEVSGGDSMIGTITEDVEQDIDVLFYGSLTNRRIPIWQSILNTGLDCVHLFGVYGAARDAYIARSKIVLNLHAYPTSPREDVRLSYLWANRAFVLSEGNGTASGTTWSGPASGPFEYKANQLPESCIEWVKRDDRRMFAELMHQSFKKLRQADYLRPLIAIGGLTPEDQRELTRLHNRLPDRQEHRKCSYGDGPNGECLTPDECYHGGCRGPKGLAGIPQKAAV